MSSAKKGFAGKSDRISIGVCYYPEQWPEDLWEEDLSRMKAAGIAAVRVAEFAWNLTEPSEGQYRFDFWDRFLGLCEQCGMKVIFCTPTATPPAWLSHKHPEILNRDENGLPYRHGSRRHYNYNSPVYLEYVRRIVTVLAQRYGNHSAIWGWQIDNEVNCELNLFFSEADNTAFRRFAREKYTDLDTLNEAWGTVFWNQTYTAWEQVGIPYRVPGEAVNPHLHLDYLRFISDSARKFVKLQSDILRKYLAPGVFITTNGIFGHLDSHAMTEESLDCIMYDSYPNFAFGLGTDPMHARDLNDRKWSRHLSEVRSISPVFGVMEQQSGAGGWNGRMESPAPKPGQLRLWTAQSIAHGADYVSYFRWRTAVRGTEIYWHGILDYDSRDNRKLAEVHQAAALADALKEAAGSRYQAAFAVLKDYDNIWDAETDRWHGRLEEESSLGIFAAAQKSHTPMDYLYLREETELSELQAYPLLFAPHPAIVTEKQARLVSRYVEEGGTLILGCRCGYKQENGHCVMRPAPGLLAELAGCNVREWTFRGPADEPNGICLEQKVHKVKEMVLDAPVFSDILEVTDPAAEVLGRFATDYYRGAPALVRRSFGKGTVYTLATVFSEQNTRALLAMAGVLSPWEHSITLPESCELAVRANGNGFFYFVLNYMGTEAEVFLKKSFENAETGENLFGQVKLPPFGVLVLKG